MVTIATFNLDANVPTSKNYREYISKALKSIQKLYLYLSDAAMQTTALQKVDVQNLSKASQVIQIWLRYHYHARVSWTPSVLTVASEETISKRMSSLQRSHR
jgi:hypothetical protein